MRNAFTVIFFFMIAFVSAQQKDSLLAQTPPMGWNSWNFFEETINAQIIKEMADAMVANGMVAKGYQYIIIDDYWVGGRDIYNKLFPDAKRFPDGMKSVADYVHSRGMKLGIYSDAAEYTCGGVTASYNFEELDAQLFADWGIDYLKYDYCNAPEDVTTAFARYKKMGDALKKTGRPIVYAICEWGRRKPWLWAKAAGGNLWRTTWDSRDVWQSNDSGLTGIMEIFDRQEGLAKYAGPGAWNDPDLLMVGLYGKGKSSSVNNRFRGCNFTEYRTNFALWCMMASPLILNSDLRNTDSATLRLLTNKELLSIDQDELGKQGYTIFKKNDVQVLKKQLAGGNVAICIFNRSAKAITISLDVQKQLDLWEPYRSVRNIFDAQEEKNKHKINVVLAPHDCRVYLFNR